MIRLADMDRDCASPGNGPIAKALEWLEYLINSPVYPWMPDELAGAMEALERARFLMATPLEMSTLEGEPVAMGLLGPAPQALH